MVIEGKQEAKRQLNLTPVWKPPTTEETMSIGREYYDEEGNYWQIETPYYIPPKEAIKHKEYVRGFISAKERTAKIAAANRFKRMNRTLEVATIVLIVLLIFVKCIKAFS